MYSGGILKERLCFFTALKKAGVSAELHIFPHGPHGIALANELTAGGDPKKVVPAAAKWIDLVHTWIKNL